MIAAILIRCSDPRIDKVVNELLSREGKCAIIANTGGVKYFLENRLSDLVDQIRILAKGFNVDKIIATNHHDCGFYKQLGQDEEARYPSDLKDIKKYLSKTFPQMKVECYVIDTPTLEIKRVT